MSDIPADLKYIETHQWVRVEADGTATVGITDFAQEQLGEIVFVELPDVGSVIDKGKDAAVVESVKAASDVYAPISGEIMETNDALEDDPALVTGRGEFVRSLKPFSALIGSGMLLVHPGFGVNAPWAYQALAKNPEPFEVEGHAERMINSLGEGRLEGFNNSLEAAVFPKFPVLPLIKEFFFANGVRASLMSGSGSTMFAITGDRPSAEALRAKYHDRFGQAGWSATVAL